MSQFFSSTAVKSTDADENTEQNGDLLQQIESRFAPKFEELQETAKSLASDLEEASAGEASPDSVKELTERLNEVDEAQKFLNADREKELAGAEMEALKTTVKSLRDVIEAPREAHSDFLMGGTASSGEQSATYGPDSDNFFFVDAAKSLAGHDREATERWQEAMAEKTMTQAAGSTGGYLVPPQISAQLLELREQQNILRPLFSRIPVTSDTLRIATVVDGLLAGWVAELAEKPKSDLKFGELSVNVFWKAGMSVVSNQMLRNSSPSIDGIVYRDLTKRLAALEEIAFISGTGKNQPEGILNTDGVQHNGDNPLTSTDVDDLLDAVVDGITEIYTNYYGAPNAILMHPRTWARIVKARGDEAYLVGPPSHAQGGGRDYTNELPGYGNARGGAPVGSLFGLPVYTTRNVPTNAGAADNESRIIIGNFEEGLILDHAGVSLDASEHVYFTSNATVLRAEDAVGFTAARYPAAFYVVGGTGLANG